MSIQKSNYIHIILFSISLLILFSQISSQKIKDLTIGKPISGRMEIDESHEYFKLVIPKAFKGKLLQITTKQNKDEEIKEDEPFSDPDVYVSKINKYPSSPRSAEWYSERYGSDVLTIPAESLNPDDVLYIGMYCQFKCRYHLNIKESKETEIFLGEYNFITLQPHETINYKLYIEKEFEELNVVAFSNNGKFRIFMNKNAPSSQNTFNVIPSWSNGYVFQVKKENAQQYCTDCYYHIVVHNDGEETINSLTLYTNFPDKILNLKPEILLYDAVEKNSKKCYSFDITPTQKKEKLIIQTNMYSGNIYLSIDGWTYTERKIHFLFPYPKLEDQDLYRIDSELFYLIQSEDFQKFDESNPEFKGKNSQLHFCYYSSLESSYSVNVYFLSRLENIQNFNKTNILTPSKRIRTYLLKDQMMKYELIGLNLEKKDVETNITLTTTKVLGSTKMFAYFCTEEKCLINKMSINALNTSGNLISAYQRDFETDLLYIPYEKNKCYKTPKVTLKNGNIIDCAPIVGVLCETPNENGLCVFDIQLTVNQVAIMMTPKQMYYGSIPIGKQDFYRIRITDPEIDNLVVVLNSESGDAELFLYKVQSQGQFNTNQEKLISVSFHDDYIPDVIRITPKRLKQENIVGDYTIKITATCYSNYNLYYYVLYKKDKTKDGKNVKLPEVTMNLEIGQVITDYFPNDIRYKIYSFTPVSEKSNLKVFLDRVNVDFTLYVYSDISNFKILQMYEIDRNNPQEPITGYDWKSQGNNEINLLKSDPKFKTGQMYYIIIAPNLPKEPDLLKALIDFFRRFPFQWNQTEIIDKKAPIKFYLGVTEINEQITISEGVPHTLTLNKDYNGQNYFYEHYDLNSEFELDINVIMGSIDIFIDVREINEVLLKEMDIDETKADIQKSETMIYKLGINKNFESIIINKEYLQQNIKDGESSIKIYFYIRRSKTAVNYNQECKYTITQKSSTTKGELLQPGLVKKSKIIKGQKHFYIIEEVRKRKSGGVINVNFVGGSGNIYVKIPKVPESKNIRFPSIGDHDYKGDMVYSGKLVKIPGEVYERMNSQNPSLQILITVEGGVGSLSDEGENNLKVEEIYYSISYSGDPKMIGQNEPYDGYITKGELQYYSFYFDENVKNIYFGIYNMDGDADMYINYGLSLPTPSLNDWKTNGLSHEYIDINLDDDFFKKEKRDTISGYYTLLIEGFTNTTFSLFVGTHAQKVLPLRNNRPVQCKCTTKGQKCFLRYNEVFDKENKANGILNNNIIFTTNYLYGNGKMYAKLYRDSELHGEDFYKLFPDEKNYEKSNKESNQRNYMKMEIQESKYSEDSAILMTFICEEKTQVDISATILRHYTSVDYIQENKENVFFIGKKTENNEKIEQPELKLYFRNFFFNRKDFIYSIHAYTGDAHVKIYYNDSRWDISQQKELYDYSLFKEFDVLSSNEDAKDNIEVYNPFGKDYFGVITTQEYSGHNNFVFHIIPKGEFGFYIQCNYEKDWNEIIVEKSKSFGVRGYRFYGYFDISEDYGDLEVSLSLEKNILLSADLYIKINIVDTTKKLKAKEGQNLNGMNLYHYSYPSEDNYDYHVPTDDILGSLALNIHDIPKIKPEDKSTKFIRALMYVRLKEENFDPIHPYGPGGPMGGRHGRWPHGGHWGMNEENLPVINILITPGFQNVKYVDTNPNEYYFSNLTYASNSNRVPESKIYTLRLDNEDDDVLVIEISTCRGNYEYSITDILENAGEEKTDKNIEVIEKQRDGKNIIYIHNVKSKVYYLTIRAKMSDFLCELKYRTKQKNKSLFGKKKNKNETLDNIPKECGNNLVYLMYYYSMQKNKGFFTSDEFGLSKLLFHEPYGKGKIKINIPRVIKKDINHNNITIEDYKLDIFATKNENYYKRMGSVCFLSQFKNYSQDTIFKVEDVKHVGNQYLVISGLGYRQKYYINILAQSTTTKELIAFSPFIMWTGGYLPFPLWQTALVSYIIILILIILLFIFVRKYCSAKEELKVIKGDTLPKTEAEVNSGTMEDRIVYSGLGSSY